MFNPKSVYVEDEPLSEQILENPKKHKGSHLSLLNRTRTKIFTDDISNTDSDPTEKDPKEESNKLTEWVLKVWSPLTGSTYCRTKEIIDLLKKSVLVLIDEGEKLTVDAGQTNISASSFSNDLQQPTKKLQNPDLFKLLEAINPKQELVININAKAAIREL